MKKVDEKRSYLVRLINQSKLMNYIDHLLIIISTVNGYVSVSGFASLVGITIGVTTPAIGFKMCPITAEIIKYNSIIKKKKSDKTVLLPQST